ncbi:glycosyltransferase family 2 protein [Streptococcus pyogenes]|uniref:glycosyltransferase family 2 protein n=1 Tax=Streptococcus pyogenes TaxID=1314 RepID=UPI0013300ADC|nr:glycosyltransferase [Streptococcus pyogenes]
MYKVSIICTNYNKAPWISDALDSFLSQVTDFEVEIIVIDDASTDDSREILKSYQKKSSGKIKLLFNETNIGITKTWIKACLYAKGKYIARCDGDDYWTDSFKLQKQVDVLEASKRSRWCNTDFDFVNSQGDLLYANAFSSGHTPLTDTYEKVLALKGMTMASTWLVDADLMRQVNQKINVDTPDDTFDIQLELFQLTQLTYIKNSTTIYRMTTDSDSRPTDTPKMIHRIQKLLDTQLNYLKKYNQVDTKEVSKLLLQQDAKQEIRIHELSCFIQELQQTIVDKTKQQETREVELQNVIEEQKNQLSELRQQYHAIINSRQWKYTSKLIAFIRRKK